MKKMNVVEWEATGTDGKVVKESIIEVLATIISNNYNVIGKGIDAFRFCHRIIILLIEAKKTGILEIEEGDYIKLSDIIRKNISSNLGCSPDIYIAIEEFLKLQ